MFPPKKGCHGPQTFLLPPIFFFKIVFLVVWHVPPKWGAPTPQYPSPKLIFFYFVSFRVNAVRARTLPAPEPSGDSYQTLEIRAHDVIPARCMYYVVCPTHACSDLWGWCFLMGGRVGYAFIHFIFHSSSKIHGARLLHDVRSISSRVCRFFVPCNSSLGSWLASRKRRRFSAVFLLSNMLLA